MNPTSREFITFDQRFDLENKSKAESLITKRPGIQFIEIKRIRILEFSVLFEFQYILGSNRQSTRQFFFRSF